MEPRQRASKTGEGSALTLFEPDHHHGALRAIRADELVIPESGGNQAGLEKIQGRLEGGIGLGANLKPIMVPASL